MTFRLIFDFFLLFVESRVLLRFRDKSITARECLAWSILWISAGVVINWPGIADTLALRLGINRGSDFIVYASIASIFYVIFRMYIKLSYIERELTQLTRELALKDVKIKE